jgi:hypothetical protein
VGMKKIAFAICFLLFSHGCLKIEFTGQKPPEKEQKTVQQTVAEPSEGSARYFTFTTNAPYRIDFSISESDIAAAEALLKAIDREGLENSEGRLFALDRNDRNFLLSYWQCIYHSMYRLNKPIISRLADVFKRIKQEQNLNDLQLAYVIVRFVQSMQYYIPPGIGIYSPARVLLELGKGKEGPPPAERTSGWHGAGDCDTKSLLMVLLFIECGYDAVVLDSYRYHHAMAAISLPGPDGTAIEYRGKNYFVIESTYPNWTIGQMPPQYTDLSFFLPIDPREGRPTVEKAIATTASSALVHAQGASEREPNNNRTNADKIGTFIIDGELDETDPEDWYRLGGQEGTFAAITIIHDENCDFNFDVYSDETIMGSARSNSRADTISVAIPGVCHLRVYRVSGNGKYTIIISPGGAAEKEPNNDAENATAVSEMAIFGELDSSSDVDMYSLGGQEGFNATYTIFHAQNCNFDFEVINDGHSMAKATADISGDSITVDNPGRVHIKIWSVRGQGWYLMKITRNR